MAIEDLDLEFEDDEGGNKSDALDLDVDLSFTTIKKQEDLDGGTTTQRGLRVKPDGHKTESQNFDEDKTVKISHIAEAGKEASSQVLKPMPGKSDESTKTKILKKSERPNVVPIRTNDKELQEVKHALSIITQQVRQMQELQMNNLSSGQTQTEQELKLKLVEAEKKYLVEYVSNAKILDVQITQILLKIHAKAPELKKEVQQIKKLLNLFINKTSSK